MSDRWFVVPDKVLDQPWGETPGPKYRDRVQAFAAIPVRSEWLVRYWATTDVLDRVGSELDAHEVSLSDSVTQTDRFATGSELSKSLRADGVRE